MSQVKRIVFQGDSITDGGRIREQVYDVGYGYPLFVKGYLDYFYPGQYELYNRGIGGDQVSDIYARVERDIVALAPDYLSILVGVNDAYNEILNDEKQMDSEGFYRTYDNLIAKIMVAIPKVKIMLMEPFVLESKSRKEDWQDFRRAVEVRSQMARKISEKYNLTYISLQQKFDEVENNAVCDYWLRDGVHPTVAGKELIKVQWINGFEKIRE